MGKAMVADADLRAAIEGERADLAGLLSRLPAESWDAPTLCVGWRVRELVAHQTMPFRYSKRAFAFELLKARGRFNLMADRLARRDALRLSPEELVTALRDNVSHPWKPPGGGLLGALSHDVIHGLDMTVALAIDRRVPERRLSIVLRSLTSSRHNPFGVDLDGIALCANDTEWALGSGSPLSGAAQDLFLVYCGRKLPPHRLRGEHSQQFTMEKGSF